MILSYFEWLPGQGLGDTLFLSLKHRLTDTVSLPSGDCPSDLILHDILGDVGPSKTSGRSFTKLSLSWRRRGFP